MKHGTTALAFVSAIIAALSLSAILLGTSSSSPVHAAAASMSMSPASQSLGANQLFTITITQNADVVTTGANAYITFDPGLVRLEGIAKGSGYSNQARFNVGIAPQTVDEAIADANQTGLLTALGVFYFPGDGAVPAGPAEAFVLTMRTNAAVSGTANVRFVEGANFTSVLDLDEVSIAPALTNAAITLTDGPSVTPSNTPTITPTFTSVATNTPSPTKTVFVTNTPGGPSNTPEPTDTVMPTQPPGTATPTLIPATAKLDPATFTTAPNGEFVIRVMQSAPVVTDGIQTSMKFDRETLELLSITKGAAYGESASLFWGLTADEAPNTNKTPPPGATATPTFVIKSGQEAIDFANEERGFVEKIAASYTSSGTVAAGEQEALLFRFRARKDVSGTSTIELSELSMTEEGASGTTIGVTASSAEIVVEGDEATATPTASPTADGTVTAVATPVGVSTVAGSTSNPSSTDTSGGVTGLPNAGFFGGGTSRVILVISLITLAASLVALANAHIGKRT